MPKNYKNTLLMPQTPFAMRAELTKKEATFQQIWAQTKLYEQIQNQNASQPSFILHDGPPYANGKLHLGHALNKILKDIVVRYYAGLNYKIDWTLIWDTHGLPIEHALLKQKNTQHLDVASFRNACAQYAQSQIVLQKEGFERLGLLTNFKQHYQTMDFDYEYLQLKLFEQLYQKKLIYRDLKPVYWSCSSQSALAEAEVEYHNLSTPSIFFTFKLRHWDPLRQIPKDTKLIVWTTTPWTVPCNQLLAIGANINYCLVQVNKQHFILAEDCLKAVAQTCQWKQYHIVAQLNHQDLLKAQALHPLYDKTIKIVYGHHVNTTQGSGIVHIASGFGTEDYIIAKNNSVPVYVPLNAKGVYTKAINDPLLANQFYLKANPLIIKRLSETGHLLHEEVVTHSVACDWRTKKELIYRATEQWFLNVKAVCEKVVKNIKQMKWNPVWAITKMEDMVQNRKEWCLSRQRTWGVPFIAFYDQNHKLLLNQEILTYALAQIKKAGSCNVWFSEPANTFLPKKYHALNLTKDTAVMDVWLDSAMTSLYASRKTKHSMPFDVIVEGKDQFRGWFNSSLIIDQITSNTYLAKQVLVHGFVTDDQGHKLSKSKGNYTDLEYLVNQFGADIIRLWVATSDTVGDVRFGPDILKQVQTQYLKFRNTMRFMLGNLHDFCEEAIAFEKLTPFNQYILHKAQQAFQTIQKHYQNFDFKAGVAVLQNFITNDLSNFYLDSAKIVLYTYAAQSQARRQIQSTIMVLLKWMLYVLNPILVHTVYEAHQVFQYPHKKNFLLLEQAFSFCANLTVSKAFEEQWKAVNALKVIINKKQEEAKNAKQLKRGEEAIVYVPQTMITQTGYEASFLTEIFMVRKIIVTNSQQEVTISTEPGVKCARCWTVCDAYYQETDLCARCFMILTPMKGKNE